jgi:UDP-N-acetylmuramate-alanine ligase
VRFVAAKEAIVPLLAQEVCADDVVLTLGAGDIRAVGEALVTALAGEDGLKV